MMQKADFLKSRLDDTVFILSIYEMYFRKMPTDKTVLEMCEEYRKQYNALLEEYLQVYSSEGSGNK